MRVANVLGVKEIGWAVALALCLAPLGSGQDAKLKLDHLEQLSSKAAEVVDVTLDGPMLQMASKFMAEDNDPEAAATRELIKSLKGVYVKSFEFDKPGQYSAADVEAIRAQLKAPGWARIVGVVSKRESETDEVYLMNAGDEKNPQGLAIIAAEPTELTVVNIVGPIDLDKLSALSGHMGIPHVEVEKGAKQPKAAGKHEEKH